jgi:hypothetical protein
MKKTILFLALIILYSCNNTLDLSTVELGNKADQYDLESNKNLEHNTLKGHYEWKKSADKNTLITVDNGEIITNYHEINKIKNQFNYSGIPTDSTWDVKIVVYKGEIAEVNARFAKENTFLFLGKILKKLGNPSKVNFDTATINNKSDREIYLKLHKFFPKETKLYKPEGIVGEDFTYPRDIIWDKDKVLYIVNIIMYSENFSVNYRPMTKKACKDRVLYPAPLPEQKDNIPFYEYLK